MIFSSPIFLFSFLPVVFILYRLSKKDAYRNVLLAAASLIFYAFGQLQYVPLFLLSVMINYAAGLILRRRKSKAVLGMALTLNVALLCIFKFSAELGLTGLALPIGISFFTFQGMSYVIDTYREPEKGTADFLKLFLYISFFPRLIAGPIVPYHAIESQLGSRECTAEDAADGIRRFILGLSKKMLLAEPLAYAADQVLQRFSAEGVRDVRLAWIFALCYMLQLYYDFSGYSDMAVGTGRMFGFSFPENFDRPYGAGSIKEFWRKWHISLSSWFKEYLYIPLGGNRKGKLRAAANRMLVFLCTGLWHGAGLTYLFWGIGHGVLSSLEDLQVIPTEKLGKSRAGRITMRLYTLLAVCLLFVIFRSESLGQGLSIIGTMFAGTACAEANLLIARLITPAFLFVFTVALLGAGNLPARGKISKPLSYVLSIMLLLLSVLALAKSGSTPFIYAQF